MPGATCQRHPTEKTLIAAVAIGTGFGALFAYVAGRGVVALLLAVVAGVAIFYASVPSSALDDTLPQDFDE